MKPTFTAVPVDDNGKPILKRKRKPKRPTRKLEYRVTYQRDRWEHSKSRTFQVEFYAKRFVRKLRGSEWEYGLLKVLRVDVRDVGPWKPVKPGGSNREG